MPKYRVHARVLGLDPKDEFTSEDEFYRPFLDGGYLSVVEEAEGPENSSSEPEGGEEPETSTRRKRS